MSVSDDLNNAAGKWSDIIERFKLTCPCCPLNESGRVQLSADLSALGDAVVMAGVPPQALAAWEQTLDQCLDLLKADGPIQSSFIQAILHKGVPDTIQQRRPALV
jgi:hypothetical protein